MSNVLVFKDGAEWYFECSEHDESLITGDWAYAYEAALGHVCMHHPGPPCDHRFGYIDPVTNDHRCLFCRAELPLIPEPPC